MSAAVLVAATLGCAERSDLAPVRTGHQSINDAYPGMSYPPPVANGNVPPEQRQQVKPPPPRHPYAQALRVKPSLPRREASATAASSYPAVPSQRGKAKGKPETISSNLTANKSIMLETGHGQPVSKASATEKKPTSGSSKKASAKKDSTSLSFGWPLAGNVLKSYAQTGKKGIKIAGKKGQTVRAAEAGKVVYSGQGLIGYGNLLIIKHNDQYLTAYANNSDLLAREGDIVKKGQGIATVGLNAAHKPMLHFEIRKQGKSVNPLTLLPKL